MRIRKRLPTAIGLTAFAIALGSGCTRREPAPADHPQTFEAAQALAASRGAPVLVDFFSPT